MIHDAAFMLRLSKEELTAARDRAKREGKTLAQLIRGLLVELDTVEKIPVHTPRVPIAKEKLPVGVKTAAELELPAEPRGRMCPHGFLKLMCKKCAYK